MLALLWVPVVVAEAVPERVPPPLALTVNWSPVLMRPATLFTKLMRGRLVFVTVQAAAEFVAFSLALMLRFAGVALRAGLPVTGAQLIAAVLSQSPPAAASVMVSVWSVVRALMNTRAVSLSRRVKLTLLPALEKVAGV